MQTYDLPKRLSAQAMREANEQITAKHNRGEFELGDPNHPQYNNGISYTQIFGYEKKAFLERQNGNF